MENLNTLFQLSYHTLNLVFIIFSHMIKFRGIKEKGGDLLKVLKRYKFFLKLNEGRGRENSVLRSC